MNEIYEELVFDAAADDSRFNTHTVKIESVLTERLAYEGLLTSVWGRTMDGSGVAFYLDDALKSIVHPGEVHTVVLLENRHQPLDHQHNGATPNLVGVARAAWAVPEQKLKALPDPEAEVRIDQPAPQRQRYPIQLLHFSSAA